MDQKLSEANKQKLVDALLGKPPPLDPFYNALGKFVLQFANTEANVRIALWRFADVKHPVGNAVFSGVKIDQAMSLIGRIADAQKWKKARRAELTALQAQLSQINALRNEILHLGAAQETLDTWRVSNRLFAHVRRAIRTRRVTKETLENAITDLDTIRGRLVVLAWGTTIPLRIRRTLSGGVGKPWLYKPPPQPLNRRKSRGKRPKPARLPKPSQA